MNRYCLAELTRAQQARRDGNEGRARVCARRAAGMAAKEFLHKRGITIKTSNIMDSLHSLQVFPGLAPGLQTAISHMLLPVNKDFRLPVDVDLIADAEVLILGLENNG